MVDPRRIKRKQVLVLVGVVIALGAMSAMTRFFTPNKFQADWYPSIPFQEGTSYTTWSFFSINSTQARADYQKMNASSVEWVAINAYWYQANLTSTTIYPDFWTESLENLSDAVQYARSIGLHVLYKPMIQVATGEWRAWIHYSPEWMQSYTDWLVSQAADAEQWGVEIFCIGCEMNSMQSHSYAMRTMIAEVREVFHGKLTYSANYDSFWYLDWYDAIDIIGISMYPAMAFDYSPTAQELIQFWNGFYTRLEALSAKWNLPVMFTEIGAEALDGSNMSPSHNQISTVRDVEELCDIYRSVFESRLWTAPWFKGVYWWVWDNYEPDPEHPENDINFSPEIPAVLAILTTEYSFQHQYVPSDFLIRLMVPMAVGITMFIMLAWKMEVHPNPKDVSQKESEKASTRSSGGQIVAIIPPKDNLILLPATRFAIAQGSLAGVFFYLIYAQFILPSYIMIYYRPDVLAFYAGMVLGIFILSRIFLHYSARFSVQALLLIPFIVVLTCPLFFFGISIDGTWLKLFIDVGLLAIVIVVIIRVNAACPDHEKNRNVVVITASLVNFLFLLVCSVFFDQMALSFAVIPIGLSMLKVSPDLVQKHTIGSPSNLTRNRIKSTFYIEKHDVSLLLAAFLAGVLLPIASSNYNLLYMNLLPLILSILPPVLAGGVLWLIYLLWSKFHKRRESRGFPVESTPVSSPLPSSLRRLYTYLLVLEIVAVIVVLANGPHLIWSLFAGVFVVLFLSTIQFRIEQKVQNNKEIELFYFLFGIVLMISAGMVVHAVKGSQIYSITSPIQYNLVIAINLVILAGCFILTFVGFLPYRGIKKRI
nr:hypothetical protein [Candidatus Sigynarchaeota archaeon]